MRVEVPDAEGETAFVYTIQNERLGTASTFLRVIADDDAPLARPEASDTVLSLSDILDEDVVDVEVLRNVFLADGDAADLTVGLVAGYDSGAQVRRDGSIRVTVRGPSPDHPVLGEPPRGSDRRLVRVHLGARSRRRPAAAAPRRARSGGAERGGGRARPRRLRDRRLRAAGAHRRRGQRARLAQ